MNPQTKALSYLGDHTWDEVTREERVFCAELWFNFRDDPTALVQWLQDRIGLSLTDDELRATWSLGFETCFYRDARKAFGKGIKGSGYPQKRTFDLCLFSERTVVIIEAKAFESYTGRQNLVFGSDENHIKRLAKELGSKFEPKVILISLSKRKPSKNDPFFAHVTWEQLLSLRNRLSPRLISMIERLYRPVDQQRIK